MNRRGLLLVAVLGVLLSLSVMPASGVDLTARDGVSNPPVSMSMALTAQADATSDLLEEDGIVGTGVGVGPDNEAHVVVLLETPQDAAQVPGSIEWPNTNFEKSLVDLDEIMSGGDGNLMIGGIQPAGGQTGDW